MTEPAPPYALEFIRTTTILRQAFQHTYWQEGMAVGAIMAALVAEFITVARSGGFDPDTAFPAIALAIDQGRLDPSHDPAGGRYTHPDDLHIH